MSASLHSAYRDPASGNSASINYPPERPTRHHRSSSRSFIEGVTLARSRAGSYSRLYSNEHHNPTTKMPSEQSTASPRDQRRRSVDAASSARKERDQPAGATRWSHSSASSVRTAANIRRSRASSGATFAQSLDLHLSPTKRERTGTRRSPSLSPTRVTSRDLRLRSLDFGESLSSNTPFDPIAAPSSRELVSPSMDVSNDLQPNGAHGPATVGDLDYIRNDHDTNPSPEVTRKNRAPSTQEHIKLPSADAATQGEPPRDLSRKARMSDRADTERRPSTPYDASGQRRSKIRDGKEKDKKSTLSKALQKANTAVLLDNAQNFEGALDAYGDACRLLQHVMDCSTAHEDKRKLESIKLTYTNRIAELRELEMKQPVAISKKSLPARPKSDESFTAIALSLSDVKSASSQARQQHGIHSMVNGSAPTLTDDRESATRGAQPMNLPQPGTARTSEILSNSSIQMNMVTNDNRTSHQGSFTEPPKAARDTTFDSRPESKETKTFVPKPLFQRQKSSENLNSSVPGTHAMGSIHGERSQALDHIVTDSAHSEHTARHRAHSTNSNAWLNTIDENISDGSSVHSNSSMLGLRRKHIRGISGITDPDFDAAFDAAVEAAYDEGFEPDLDMQNDRLGLSKTMLNFTDYANSGEEDASTRADQSHAGTDVHASETEDEMEERLLASINADPLYIPPFSFDSPKKAVVPRASDSSGYSRSTWQSSHASTDRATTTTVLSTVEEHAAVLPPGKAVAPNSRAIDLTIPVSVHAVGPPPLPPPPPNASLPPLPKLPPPPAVAASIPPVPTVRSRRLSGQLNPKNLKIETSGIPPETRKRASTFHHSPNSAIVDTDTEPFDFDARMDASKLDVRSAVQPQSSLGTPPTLDLRSAVSDSNLAPFSHAHNYPMNNRNNDESHDFLSARPLLFRKNKSSISLRAEHTLLVSPTDSSAPPLFTPMSATFMGFQGKRGEDPRESQRAKFSSADIINSGSNASGIYLFDTSLSINNRPNSPRSPPYSSTQAPSLEPCPDPTLLRPFWLMRTLATTLTHATGGFLTTRLFIPREVWLTRGVKLKAVEDKVANCDLLTAALGRLANVDTFDADAVMEELQSFEEVMEKVQSTLSRKLGSDVGVHGIMGFFKDAPTNVSAQTASAESAPTNDKNRSKESKPSYLSSWRKLRNKSSAAQTSSQNQAKKAEDRDAAMMASVPMTTFVPVERRGYKKDSRNAFFDGPNKDYMGSLARLFEGAQILDQIARQVEDPGLRHSSPTHVGLELSIRHAAEFFGFFICRFVIADLGLLLDKFVKRGTEWALV